MKNPFLSAIATVAGIGFASLLLAQPSLAQSIPVNSFPSTINSEKENNNPFSPGNSEFNMFDLIHRANFGNLNWNSAEQNQKLDEAAEAYKKLQQQRWQNSQNNSNSVTPSNQPPGNQPAPGN
jgi:hypothetical protein